MLVYNDLLVYSVTTGSRHGQDLQCMCVYANNRDKTMRGAFWDDEDDSGKSPHAMLMPTNKLSNLTIFATKQTYRGSFNFVHCLV